MTTMTPNEILEEYKKDYPVLRTRVRNFLQSNNRSFISRFKSTKNPIVIPDKPRSTVVNGSRYQISLKIYCGKSGFERFEMTVYQVLLDSRSGKLRTWLLSTPNSEKKPFILEFRIEFIRRMYPGIPTKEAIDKFMHRGLTYTLYEKSNNEYFNFEAFFGGDFIGFGSKEESRYLFEKIYTNSDIIEMGNSLGLEGDQDPLDVYTLWETSKKETSETIEITENLSEEEKKKLEIEKAWKEYESL